MIDRSRLILFVAGGVAAALIAVAFAAPADLVLYNHSPSVPEGFYVRADAPATEGSFVTVRARDVAPEEARRRDFTGPSDRFIKRIAAVGGERVCGDGSRVIVGDDAIVVTVLSASAQHRAHADDGRGSLVGWRGCRILGADEVLLLGDTPDSFDGRYWGPINVRLIEGVWRKL
jgi:type IV secretory pathway protease TraF